MTIHEKSRDEKPHYVINRLVGKMSSLSSGR